MRPIPVNLEPKSQMAARIDASLGSWFQLHNALTDHREDTCTQQLVADRLEITQPAVSVFEKSNGLGTQIGTIISYAAAIGLEVEFRFKEASYPDLPEASREGGPFQD
jgi:predicted XRE-type DNA-binding protein